MNFDDAAPKIIQEFILEKNKDLSLEHYSNLFQQRIIELMPVPQLHKLKLDPEELFQRLPNSQHFKNLLICSNAIYPVLKRKIHENSSNFVVLEDFRLLREKKPIIVTENLVVTVQTPQDIDDVMQYVTRTYKSFSFRGPFKPSQVELVLHSKLKEVCFRATAEDTYCSEFCETVRKVPLKCHPFVAMYMDRNVFPFPYFAAVEGEYYEHPTHTVLVDGESNLTITRLPRSNQPWAL